MPKARLDAGPDTIAWHLQHHRQITVSPATISRYLARAGLVTPEPARRPGPHTCGSKLTSPANAGRPTSPA
jgi:hypothetical protein